jgi:hypothetical protein
MTQESECNTSAQQRCHQTNGGRRYSGAMSATFGFEQWWLLVLVVAALLLALVASRGRVFASVVTALRTLALVLLGLAAAGPLLAIGQPGLVVLADVSDSASALPPGLGRLPAKANLQFAGRVALAGSEVSALQTDQSDIAAALQVAAAYAPSRILLVSDGNATANDPLRALPRFGDGTNVPIDVLVLPSRPNARVVEVTLPTNPSPGSTVRALAVLETSQASQIRLRASLNGRPLPSQSLDLPVGRSSLPLEFRVEQPGELELSVTIEPLPA